MFYSPFWCRHEAGVEGIFLRWLEGFLRFLEEGWVVSDFRAFSENFKRIRISCTEIVINIVHRRARAQIADLIPSGSKRTIVEVLFIHIGNYGQHLLLIYFGFFHRICIWRVHSHRSRMNADEDIWLYSLDFTLEGHNFLFGFRGSATELFIAWGVLLCIWVRFYEENYEVRLVSNGHPSFC